MQTASFETIVPPLPLGSLTAVAPVPIIIHDFAQHRGAMLRFARRKIRDQDLAEDAVQDALLAALNSAESYKGQSQLRTWLIGILNHKIQDAFRRETRYQRVAGDEFGSDDDLASDDSMDRLQYERDEGSDADNPQIQVVRQQMMEELEREVAALPPTLRDVFSMQALEDMSTEEVCAKLGITEANCWVRLHRARKRLAGRMGAHLN
jgi:RNA polymerase sigma-70 factor, ECF subfamily